MTKEHVSKPARKKRMHIGQERKKTKTKRWIQGRHKCNKTIEIRGKAIHSAHDVIDIINIVVFGRREIWIKPSCRDVVPLLGRDVRGTRMK